MKEGLVEKADKLAGYTAFILIILGVIQIIFGEYILLQMALIVLVMVLFLLLFGLV